MELKGRWEQNRYENWSGIRKSFLLTKCIAGGHAWFWKYHNSKKSLLLDHPGNSFLSNFGIAFSDYSVDHEDAKVPMKTSEIPSVKHSYYFFSLMRSMGSNYHLINKQFYDVEFNMHLHELEKHPQFQDITELNRMK